MRTFAGKKRNEHKRRIRPLMIMVAEGENVTEQQYFNWFRSPDSPYTIIFHKAGHVTDPAGLMESVEKRWVEEDGSSEDGDLCYVILDLDCDQKKAEQIRGLQSKSSVASFIVSNPCFEIWFLLHFQYTTHFFTNGKPLIRELRKFVPGYKKDMDVYPVLKEMTSAAIENSKKLTDFFEEDRYSWPDARCNPWTDVWKLVERLE